MSFRLIAGLDAAIAVVVITRNNQPVRTLTAVPSEFMVIPWDGRDWEGRMVPDGYYRYSITFESSDSDASLALEGVIEVDSAVHFVGVPPRY